MKKLMIIILILISSTFAVFAQNGKDEQEILKIHSSLEQAVLKKDAAVFERVFADDYVYSNPYGEMMNRVQSLEDMRKEWANTKFKKLTASTDDIKVKVSGNMALVSANWTATAVPLDDPNSEPHKDTGRYTGVYEKRGGKWLLVAEHFSEAPHDRNLMQQQVLKAGREYNELMKRLKSGRSYSDSEKSGDITVFDRLLADEYTYTSRDGEISNKAEDLKSYKTNQIKIESTEILEQNVRVIGNNAAIETGKIRYVGANAGKPFDIIKRYTTTWVWRSGRWQIVADHTSAVKQ